MSGARLRRLPRRLWLVVPTTVFALAAGLGVAQGAMGGATNTHAGHGASSFGKTLGRDGARASTFTYNHGYYCDTRVAAKSTTGCEVGEAAKIKKPKGGSRVDPLYIIVPLGFTDPVPHDCPTGVTCIDHPETMDLTRIAPVLAPIFKTTADQLSPALENFMTPGHDHFVTYKSSKPEWWNVEVIGVADAKVYQQIRSHHSLSYVRSLQKAKNPAVTPDVPTNLFLWFSAS